MSTARNSVRSTERVKGIHPPSPQTSLPRRGSLVSAAEESARICSGVATRAQKSIRVEICPADVSVSDERRKLIDFTKAQFGRLDLLVNNAGVAPSVRADILEAGEESFDRLMNINIK